MSELSENLKSIRKRSGRSQLEVSKYIGVTRATLSSYERGVITPPYSKMVQLARYYNLTIEELNTGIISNDSDLVDELTRILERLKSVGSVVTVRGLCLSERQKRFLKPIIEASIELCIFFKEG